MSDLNSMEGRQHARIQTQRVTERSKLLVLHSRDLISTSCHLVRESNLLIASSRSFRRALAGQA